MRARYYVLLASAVLLAVSSIAGGAPAFAQYSCGAQVGYPVTASAQAYAPYAPSAYANSWNIRLTVPIVAGCNYGPSQLYAVGTAFDPVTNMNVASANTVMAPSVNGYSGQLVFTLPPSVLQHELQMSIQIYSGNTFGYYSGQVASTYFTVTIHPAYANYYGYNYYNAPYMGRCYNNGYAYVYYYNGYYYYYQNCYYYGVSD